MNNEPIHTESQNQSILNHLQSGKTITSLDAWLAFGCSALHSRISDIRNKMGVQVDDKWTTVTTSNGKKRVKEYSIKQN